MSRLKRRDVLGKAARLSALTLLSSCGGQLASPKPTPRPRRIGYLLHGVSTAASIETRMGFVQRLRELGHVEGTDVVVEVRYTENDIARLPGLAAELVAIPVDVLVTPTGPPSRAAKDATSTIPIVFVQVTDPIAHGLVTDLARPGGNITGIYTASLAIAAKRVELLKETLPDIKRIAVLWNANMIDMAKLLVPATESTARAFGAATVSYGVHNPVEVDMTLGAIARERFDAIVMLPSISVIRDARQVPTFAEKMRLPQIYSDIEVVRAGGLMHVGSNYVAQYRRAADFVDKVLSGAPAGDIPVEQAAQFDFIINIPAAERIGLTIPPSVLAQATQVIR